jgi:hypothetical protein
MFPPPISAQQMDHADTSLAEEAELDHRIEELSASLVSMETELAARRLDSKRATLQHLEDKRHALGMELANQISSGMQAGPIRMKRTWPVFIPMCRPSIVCCALGLFGYPWFWFMLMIVYALDTSRLFTLRRPAPSAAAPWI